MSPKLYSSVPTRRSPAKKSCATELSDAQALRVWGAIFSNVLKDDPTDPVELAIMGSETPYRLSKGYYKWAPPNQILPYQGWKFHVLCDESNMAEVLALLPELRKIGAQHKLLSSQEEYLDSLKNPQSPNKGKFLTIYPANDKEAAEIASLLNQKLNDMGLSRSAELSEKLKGSNIEGGDIPLGTTGLLSARYGKVGGVVEKINGVASIRVEVNGRVHVIPYFENIQDFIVTPDGNLIEDPRSSIPNWLEIPQGIRSLMQTRN